MKNSLKAKFNTQWDEIGEATSWIVSEVICFEDMPIVFWYSTNTQKLFAKFHTKHTSRNGHLLA